jgi:hypothetical protein
MSFENVYTVQAGIGPLLHLECQFDSAKLRRSRKQAAIAMYERIKAGEPVRSTSRRDLGANLFRLPHKGERNFIATWARVLIDNDCVLHQLDRGDPYRKQLKKVEWGTCPTDLYLVFSPYT